MKKKLLLNALTLFAVFELNAQVTQINSNRSLEFDYPLTNNKSIYTSSTDSTIWVTDGTLAGTVQLSATIKFIGSLGSTTFLNGKLIFSGTTPGTGAELYVTDGTTGGTTLVADINPGPPGSAPDNDFALLNGVIYFTAERAGEGRELWRTNGTAAGTALVKDIVTGPESSNSPGNYELFSSGSYLLFAARTPSSGIELWKSDGTTAGTNLLLDINTGHAGADSSNPRAFYLLNSTVLFAATNSTNGEEVWRTNGTVAGTSILMDINTGPASSTKFEVVPGFSVPFLNTFHTFNNRAYFNAYDGASTGEIWSTDGTPANTGLVKDVVTGSLLSPSYVLLTDAVNLPNKFIFSAANQAGRSELWQSDGTPNGTTLFKAFTQTQDNPFPYIFVPFSTTDAITFTYPLFQGNKFFFVANTAAEGNELWVTDGVDGTAAHTHIVSDINPGAESSITSDQFSYIYTTAGLYFSADDGTTGPELWKTDGTPGNTSNVADIITGATGSDPLVEFFLVNNKILFEATNGDNADETDLYAVDGNFTPLPLKLGDFTVVAKSADAIVQWHTLQELNTKNFTVQRSVDGLHFQDIGIVEASGTSTNVHAYTFKDAGIINSGSTILYYRLLSTDKDGKSGLSPVITLKIRNAGKWTVRLLSNPVPDRLTIILSGINENVQLSILDMSGKKLYTTAPGAVNGQVSVPCDNLQHGTYLLLTETGKDKKLIQFVK